MAEKKHVIRGENTTKSGKTIGTVHRIGEWDDYGSISGDEETNRKYAAKATDRDYGKYQHYAYRTVTASDGSALLIRTNLKTGQTSSSYYRDATQAKSDAARMRNMEKKAAIERMGKDNPDAKKAWDDKKKAQQEAMRKGRHGDGEKHKLEPIYTVKFKPNKKSDDKLSKSLDKHHDKHEPTSKKDFKSLAKQSQEDISKLKQKRKAEGKSTSLSAMAKDGDIRWITVDGRHIPLKVR